MYNVMNVYTSDETDMHTVVRIKVWFKQKRLIE